MSVYGAIPLPHVAYTILHRSKPGVSRAEYESTILEMHRRVEEESALFTEEHGRSRAGLSARQAQNLRGALSQFLEMPIRSDDAEIQRIFQEGCDELLAQATSGGPNGALGSWAGFTVADAGAPAWLKKLESNGRRYAKSLGVEGGKGPGETYESVYVVRGGVNLDVLEHIVRDRLGIYASPHGTHIGQASPFVVAAHNMVHSSVPEYWKPLPSAWGEAVLFFEKGAIPYEEFRSSLSVRIDGAVSASGAPAASLWQRKLGLGRGSEFALRVALPGRDVLPPFVESLRSAGEPPFGRESPGGDVSLLVKELFHPRPS